MYATGLCPLLSQETEEGTCKSSCIGEECAWWVTNERKCIMFSLLNQLDSIDSHTGATASLDCDSYATNKKLDNISDNVGKILNRLK